MKKKRFSESQIVEILKAGDAGMPTVDICRTYGVAQSTYYKWQTKFGGMTASDLKKLKKLEHENQRLKQMYATLSMDHELLKDILEKKLDVDLSEEL